jgi:hypothetical protein
MAGFDIRWNSPIGNFPYAIYAQYIGEDESSYVPAKYIAQLGLEMWKPLADGGLVQGFFEYATTTCQRATDRGPYYNCAYNQGRFSYEGYRYKGRVIGYSSDRDAENWALGATFAEANGALWTAAARRSRLNRDDFGESATPSPWSRRATTRSSSAGADAFSASGFPSISASSPSNPRTLNATLAHSDSSAGGTIFSREHASLRTACALVVLSLAFTTVSRRSLAGAG